MQMLYLPTKGSKKNWIQIYGNYEVGLNSRWVSVVEFHDQALGIGKVFGQESTVVKWN